MTPPDLLQLSDQNTQIHTKLSYWWLLKHIAQCQDPEGESIVCVFPTVTCQNVILFHQKIYLKKVI